jgi:hypothetical protein
MKMRNRFFLILFAFAALVSCQKPENDEAFALLDDDSIEAVAVELKDYTPSTPADIKGISDTCNSKTYTLVAGQTIPVGTVVVSNDLNFIYVTYNTIGEWKLDKVHLYVQDAQPAQRLTPGQAPYKVDPLPSGTTTYTFIVPMDTIECGSSIWIQAHASVSSDGNETAYGGVITPADGGSWYGNILYTVECCDVPESCNMRLSAQITDVLCTGSTGAIDLIVTGGFEPITYLWSNGATTQDLTGITAGTYFVTVTSAGGSGAAPCIRELKDIIVLSSTAINVTGIITPVSCEGNDGAINITATGGTGAFTYLWSNGAVTEDNSGLAEGDYSITVSDANQCETSARFTIVKECEEPEKIVAFARKTWQPMVHCFSEYGFTEWGWTNGALPEADGFTSKYELFSNVSGCDVSNATKVGEMFVTHFGGISTATINLVSGYTMSDSRLYIGNDVLPKVDGNYTVDPDNLPLSHSLSSATTDTYTVSGLTGSVYIICYVILDQDAISN